MVATSARELLAQHLKTQLESLAEDDPKRKLIAGILDARQDQVDAHQESLRRIALERYYALQNDDPLKEVLGRVLGEGSVPPPSTAPAPPDSAVNAFRSDAWDAINALERGQQGLFSAV